MRTRFNRSGYRMTLTLDDTILQSELKNRMETAMHDVVDDLGRTASGTAPHDKGILDKKGTGWNTDVYWKNKNHVKGTVEFSVSEGEFNYALWTHEEVYNLGEGSEKKASSGGGQGMSGTTYPVGNKYLERPFHGEAETYKKHIEKTIKEGL
jgi:hypothetical protein